MKAGKISEVQCKRSVLKWIPPKGEQVIQGAGIGHDYGALQLTDDCQLVTVLSTITFDIRQPEKYAFYKALNKLELSGGQPLAIMVNAMLPARGNEARIRELTKHLADLCVQTGVEYLGGHTELLEELRSPVITVVAYGRRLKTPEYSPREIKAGQEILMIGSTAAEATAILAENMQTELNARYTLDYIQGASRLGEQLSLHSALLAAQKETITYMHDISTGGVFAALWEVGEAGDCGIEAEIKAIPIRQETVEVCEFFDINPYMALGGGAVLLVTPKEETAYNLQQAGIFAVRIGQTTESNDRVIRQGEDFRYLTPPKGDEIYKIYRS